MSIERDHPHVKPRGSDVGLFLLTYVALVAVGVLIGKGIMAWKAFDRADGRANVWLADHRTARLDTLTRYGSLIGATMTKIVLTAAVTLLLLAIWRRWLEPLMVALPLVLEAAAFITITWIVDRPRPDVVRMEGSAVGSSFPSGHVAATAVYAAMVVVLFWHTRRVWLRAAAVTLCTLAILAAGYSRAYRGMHHISDVVAGVLLGLFSVWWCRWFLLRMVAREETDQVAVTPAPAVAG